MKENKNIKENEDIKQEEKNNENNNIKDESHYIEIKKTKDKKCPKYKNKKGNKRRKRNI